MANRFFVWQDPSQQPENITWIELNGLEFYKLVSSKEANGRYFITLDNDISPEDDVIYIEATKEQYQDWEKTLSHHRYLAKFYGKYEIISIDAAPSNDLVQQSPEQLEDALTNVEKGVVDVAMHETLLKAVATLSGKSREAIIRKYFESGGLSDREIAEELGIKSKTFEKRRERALEALRKKLKLNVGKSKKSTK